MSQWVSYSVLLTEYQWTSFSLRPHIGHQNGMGSNRFGPAYGFCLRPEEICHTETQHCDTFLKYIPLQKTTNNTKSKSVCTNIFHTLNYKLPSVFNLKLLSKITVYHFFQL